MVTTTSTAAIVKFLEGYKNNIYNLHTNNCVMFIIDYLDKVHNKTVSYDNVSIKTFLNENALADLVSYKLNTPKAENTYKAKAGDIVLKKERLPALGICTGIYCTFLADKGLISSIKSKDCLYYWRI